MDVFKSLPGTAPEYLHDLCT